MDDVTTMILADSIEDSMAQAEGLSREQLRQIVEKKLGEQRVCPEVLAAWAKHDAGRAQ